MKLNILAAAVGAMFLMDEAEAQNSASGGTPEAPKPEEKPKKKPLVSVPEGAVDSWLAEGKKWGTKVREATDRAEMLAREALLVFGEYLAGEEGAGDFLTGYASAFPNINTAKVRKSEAKAVFDAFAIGDEMRTLPIGYDKEKKEAIKETHTVAEWLKMHNDLEFETFRGYAGLIRMAKQLRGASTGQGTGGGAKRKSTVTDKQQKEVENLIPLMNPQQAMSTVEAATTVLAKLPAAHAIPAMFREMAMICNKIKVMSDSNEDIQVASEILDVLNSHINLLEQRRQAELAKGTTTAPTTPKPAEQKPAEQPKPEVEVQKAA